MEEFSTQHRFADSNDGLASGEVKTDPRQEHSSCMQQLI